MVCIVAKSFRTLLLFLFMHGYAFVYAQSFDFKNFDSDMGLPQNFVYCLAQDNQGYFWIGTGEGLVRYDGIKFKTYTQNDSLASDFIHSLFVDKQGVLWVGHENGTLSYYQNGFHKVIPEEKATSPVKDICQDEMGNIWATVQNNGVVKINPNKQITTYFSREIFSDKLYYSIETINPFNFLLGTSEGLLLLKLGEDFKVEDLSEVENIPPTNINTIVKRRAIEGEYWVATEDEGFYLFRYNDKSAKHFANNKLCIKFNIEHENIIDIYEEIDGNLMLATWGNGVIKLFLDPATQTFSESFNFSTENGLNHNFIKKILGDRENNYWFATYGGGVSVLLNDYFIHYDLEDIGFKQNKAISVISNPKNLWIGLENGMLRTDPYCFADHEFYDKALGVPNDRITGFEYDETGVLWASSLNEGLYFRTPEELVYKQFNYTNSIIGKKINDMAIVGNKLYLATAGGFYIINTSTKKIEHLTTLRGLPHNNINFIYVDEKKQVWIGPKSSGICRVDSVNIEVHKLSQSPINVSGMTKDKDGNFWLSTIGKGVLKYNKDTLISVSVLDGLSKNYCYDIICDKNNRLWVCHWPGISSIDLNTMKIRNFGFKDKMGGDFYHLWEDQERNIWFASSYGVIKYFPNRDKKNLVPPKLNFTNIDISGTPYPFNKKIKLPYPYNKKKYQFKFEFTGISFKDPLGVTYQYKMDRSDDERREWINLGSTNFREYEFLPDGKYTLKVRAFNADGIPNSKPLSIQIEIQSPFWKKIWFYFAVLGGLISFIYWLIKYRERALRLQKEALQLEVASQTVVLRKQKAEIERKNQDITDSINYAKRIQKSILPPVMNLKGTFPESFIFFAPRDIVSGDFYWFNRNKDHFVLCCADCTGHGVPGAFMSMIGTTMLNDINKFENVISPADILEKLDKNIRVLLQKDGAEQYANDGMDISVIEINLNTGKLRLASAKRPVFLYLNNELTIYNGTRRSIGDDALASVSKFMNYEYDCSKGDAIYLFSDGYTDQFGGLNGRKMMKLGVKNLLEDIHNMPMEEQGDIVRDHFEKWKGELDQVDDVLFMGIRL